MYCVLNWLDYIWKYSDVVVKSIMYIATVFFWSLVAPLLILTVIGQFTNNFFDINKKHEVSIYYKSADVNKHTFG